MSLLQSDPVLGLKLTLSVMYYFNLSFKFFNWPDHCTNVYQDKFNSMADRKGLSILWDGYRLY